MLGFDIREIAQALRREGAVRYWAWLMLKPVRYADGPVAEMFPELVNGLADTLRQFIRGVKIPEMAVPQFLDGSNLLKGARYRSERELRIVRYLVGSDGRVCCERTSAAI